MCNLEIYLHANIDLWAMLSQLMAIGQMVPHRGHLIIAAVIAARYSHLRRTKLKFIAAEKHVGQIPSHWTIAFFLFNWQS